MVTLQFQRSPFHPIKHSVYTAWNEITGKAAANSEHGQVIASELIDKPRLQ